MAADESALEQTHGRRLSPLFAALLLALALPAAAFAGPHSHLRLGVARAIFPRHHRRHLQPQPKASEATTASPTAAGSTSTAPAPPLEFLGAWIGDYQLNQSAPGAVTEVPDPAGSGATAPMESLGTRGAAVASSSTATSLGVPKEVLLASWN